MSEPAERKFEHSAPRYLGYPVLSHSYWQGYDGALVFLKHPRELVKPAPDEMVTHSEAFVRRVSNGNPLFFLLGDLLLPVTLDADDEAKSEENMHRTTALIMVHQPRPDTPHGSPDHLFWVLGPRAKHLISDWAKDYEKRVGREPIRWSYPVRF